MKKYVCYLSKECIILVEIAARYHEFDSLYL